MKFYNSMGPNPHVVRMFAAERGIKLDTEEVDLNICEPLANGFRFGEGLGLFKDRITTLPDAAAGLKGIAPEKLACPAMAHFP